MENGTATLPVQRIALTEQSAKQAISVALTKQELFTQNLQSEADKLIFNEDNIPTISEFLKKVKKAETVIEDAHKTIKAPALEEGRFCDAAKNSMLAITGGIKNPVVNKYNSLCADVAKKARDQQIEEQRKQNIISGIEANVISFSNIIAAADTMDKLLSIERKINLEKSSTSATKYAEFHSTAVERYDAMLIPIIKTQKEKVKKNEALEKQLADANAEETERIQKQQEELRVQMQENKIKVQEQAINQTSAYVPVTPTIFSTPKAKRTTWKAEIADQKEAVKKSMHLLEISLNTEAVKVAMKTLQEAGAFENKEKYISNGIRYYKEVLY